MTKNAENLWELHNLERKLLELQSNLKKIPEIEELRELKPEIEELQALARKTQQEAAEVAHKFKRIEANVSDLREKLNKAEEELYSGSQAVKELEASQKNIAIIKEKIDVEEDLAISQMQKMDELQKSMEEIVKNLEQKKVLFRSLNKSFSDKKQVTIEEIESTKKSINALLEEIDIEDLEVYREKSKSYPDHSFVALLKDGVCTGCHVALSFDQLKHAKTDQSDLYCDNCGRLLVIR